MTQRIKTYQEAALEEAEFIRKLRSGEIKPLRTSLTKLNNATFNGMIPGQIWGIAGMSGAGKTRLVSQLTDDFISLQENIDQEVEILNFNYEMQARRLVLLDLARKLGYSTRQMYNLDPDAKISDEEFDQIVFYLGQNDGVKVYFVEEPANGIIMRSTIDQFMETRAGKRVVISLDHSVLVPAAVNQSEKDGLMDVMRMFNKAKKDYVDTSYIILSQMNRSIEDKERIINPNLHYPKKADIYGGDAMYMFADVIIIIHRPEILMIENYGPNAVPSEGKVFIHFIKVRDGDQQILKLENSLSTGKLTESNE